MPPSGRPATTAEAREPAVLRLTTTGRRSGLPREIEIWFTRRGNRHYLVAETGEAAQWVRNVRADPRVRWRVGDRIYAGLARIVDGGVEPELVRAVRASSEAKYGWGNGLVVELTPRPSGPLAATGRRDGPAGDRPGPRPGRAPAPRRSEGPGARRRGGA